MSIAHLSDAERMFTVTRLLHEVVSWVRSQPGTASLKAILYLDEMFGFLPPVAEPPAKKPLLTLFKQARAYGLGVVAATQNPVDLDYKALSNAGTWFVGRLQTERDRARVRDGLTAASAGAKLERADIERRLAGLRSRHFLLQNAHDDEPVLFETRWALSYLRGPLTGDQIRALMAPFKGAGPTAGTGADAGAPPARPALLRPRPRPPRPPRRRKRTAPRYRRTCPSSSCPPATRGARPPIGHTCSAKRSSTTSRPSPRSITGRRSRSPRR